MSNQAAVHIFRLWDSLNIQSEVWLLHIHTQTHVIMCDAGVLCQVKYMIIIIKVNLKCATKKLHLWHLYAGRWVTANLVKVRNPFFWFDLK